jgi:predicted transcriptional regulator
MNSHNDVLISIRPKYARHIFSGEKTVELRKRRPNILPGARIWIYATAPIAALKGYATLDQIASATPAEIWGRFGSRTGISKQEFDDYFLDRSIAHALVLSEIRVLERPLLLERMRAMVRGFHPPQFFCRLNGTVSGLRLNSRKYRKAKQN